MLKVKRKKKFRVQSLILVVLFAVTCYMGTGYAASEAENESDFASIYAMVKNAEENIVNFKGYAPNNTNVLLLVLNPGYSINDIEDNDYLTNTSVLQNAVHIKSVGGEYTCDIQFRSDIGGDFPIVAMYNDKTVNIVNDNGHTFPFYPSGTKKAALVALNGITDETTKEDMEIIIDDVLTKMSLYKDKLNVQGNKAEFSKLILSGIPYEGSLDSIGKQIRQSMILAALNKQSNNVLYDKNVFLYEEEMGLSETDEWEDYLNNISAAGKKAVHSYISSNSYVGIEAFVNDFKEAVYVNCIMNNENEGFGHVEDYLEKYYDVYKEAGLDLNAFESSVRKNDICTALVDSGASDMTSLKDNFNSLLGVKENNAPSTGGGGGKVTSSTPSREGFIKIEEKVENIKIPFGDILGYSWAHEAIGNLWKNGIIAGRSADTFAPGESVTRAEFVKMLIMGFFDENENYGDCDFEDVSKESWYYEYISKACSKEIINGIDENSFMPEKPITREQAAAVVYRAARMLNIEMSEGKEKFADDSMISDYAASAIYALKGLGIISGRENNMFAPRENITRAEAAKIIFASIKVKE